MKLRIVLIAVLSLFTVCLLAQWADLNIPMTGVWGSDVQAVDYDADGDLDIFIMGSTLPSGFGIASLYRNNGNGNFNTVNTGITGTYHGCSNWADFNGDGFMDVAINGRNNESTFPIAKIYTGSASGNFTEVNLGWVGIHYSWVDSGDYNNDGRQDILMTGASAEGDVIKLYRNDGQLIFTEVEAGLQNVGNGQCHFVDYDNDGDLDISVLGSGNCIIYRNDGTDTFVNINASLQPLRLNSSAWGDFDNDGYPDLITSGETDDGMRTNLYHNHGNGNFSLLNVNIPGTIMGSVYWGDYDNDGLLDILIAGSFSHYGTRITDIYKNNGDRSFTLQPTPFVPLSSSRAIWADLDNDGKLDVVMAGYTGTTYLAKAFRNLTPVANIMPSPPTVIFNQYTSTIEFTGASDSTTPLIGLSYNLRIGTSPGTDNVFSVLEDNTGYRRTVKRGRQKFYFEPQPLLTYYASAQAIDHGLFGSVFGQETSFQLSGIAMIAYTGAGTLDFGNISVGSESAVHTAAILNTGTSTLRVNGINFTQPNPGFNLLTTGFPFSVAPGDSLSLQLTFSPGETGSCYGYMQVFSNAVNASQFTIMLHGTGVFTAIPASIQNLFISISEDSVHLNWSPVETDTSGNPIEIDRYVVLFSEIPEPELFWYLGNSATSSFTHNDVGLCARSMFYRVKAIKFNRAEDVLALSLLETDGKRRSWSEVKHYLGLHEEER